MRENTYSDRTVTVSVFMDDGTGVEISEPACIRGHVVLDRTGNPNESVIEILNATEEFRGQIARGEFRLIRVEAGHLNANNKAIIFEGNIIRSTAKDPRIFNTRNGDDITTAIYAGEGQISFRFSTLQTVFPTGTTPRQAVQIALAEMPEITEGNLSGLDGCPALIRPYAVYGSIREFFNDLAATCDCRWSIQRTSLDFIKNDGINGQFPVLRKAASTGLFDSSLTEHGVLATFLLDPAIRPNGVVEINNETDERSSGFWRADRVAHTFDTQASGNFLTEITGQRLNNVTIIERTQERIRFRT